MNDRVALIITLTCVSAIVLVIGANAHIVGEAIARTFHNGHLVASRGTVVLSPPSPIGRCATATRLRAEQPPVR